MPEPSLVVEKLMAAGVVMTHAPHVPFLHEDLAFEGPCAIAAEITLSQPFSIGAFSHLNGGYIKDVTIGRYCSFARDVQIGHGSHPTDWLSVSPLQYASDYRGWLSYAAQFGGGDARVEVFRFDWASHTRIGNDVWLGNHVIIKDGVTVGDGAIVGAGSVVTRDVAPYMIVAGVPASPIRSRFAPDLVERLLNLRWWQYRFSDFSGVVFSDIERAVGELEDRLAEGRLQPFLPPVMRTPELR